MTTICKKYAAALTVYGVMTGVCIYSYLAQDSKDYTKPSLFNMMVGATIVGSQIALGFAIRYINNQRLREQEAPRLWQDRVQGNSQVASIV